MVNRRVGLVLGSLVLGLGCLVGAESESQVGSGRLMIAGGSLERPDRSKVFARLQELAGTTGTVGVLPTASGVPDEVGPELVEDFVGLLERERVSLIPLTTSTASLANSTTVAELIRRQHILYFSGGDQSRITGVFRPEGQPTPADDATREVLRQGGVVAGSSAGAAMQSDPMISWGNSDEALRMGLSQEEDRGVGIAPGMGYFPYGLTDQHFLARGRLGRLITAQFLTGQRFGWGVDEKRAMEVDLAQHTVTAVGEQCFLLSDIDGATSGVGQVKGIRLALLTHRDRVNAKTGEVTPSAESTPLKVGETVDGLDGDLDRAGRAGRTEAWDPFVIPMAMRRVLATGQPVVVDAPSHIVTFRPGQDLAGWKGPEGELDYGVKGVLMDVESKTSEGSSTNSSTRRNRR